MTQESVLLSSGVSICSSFFLRADETAFLAAFAFSSVLVVVAFFRVEVVLGFSFVAGAFTSGVVTGESGFSSVAVALAFGWDVDFGFDFAAGGLALVVVDFVLPFAVVVFAFG